jgi:nucleotide-binding universal stress UspA family protein
VLLAAVEHQTLLDHARRYLEQIRELLVPRLPAVAVYARSTVGDPGALIVEEGEPEELDETGLWQRADVIVMATHGRSGLARYRYGSVASFVLSHATVPVLLVHPTDGAP